jgi:LAO/AO transport system kinase
MEGVRTAGVEAAPANPLPRRQVLEVEDYVKGVTARDLTTLGRAITLVESNAPRHQIKAQQVLQELLPKTGRAKRIGITGIPGAGKSTFIEALGCSLIQQGRRVAVLAIDPSSTRTGGSILADKVRMEKLGREPHAFIRPSPAGGSLGGVARKTREAIMLCEAAGYDVIIVETVGVGQSEITVRSMVDCFMVLMIAGAGDEMQGIKKGIIELADMLIINKADGDNRVRCMATLAEMKRVLPYLHTSSVGWKTPALLASALEGSGIGEVWRVTEQFFKTLRATGEIDIRRKEQSVEWMHSLIMESLQTQFYQRDDVKSRLRHIESEVAAGQMPPLAAALDLIKGESVLAP